MKGFIFDLDGVIVSTDKYHYLAWKKMADDEGIYFDEVINDRLRGVSRMHSLEIILEKATMTYTDDEKVALATKKNDIYRESLQALTPSDRLAGVTETLAALREKGYKLAIGSSSKNTPVILEKIGYAGYFDAVSDGNNITRSKPDPEVFIKAAEFLGLAAEDCYVVEDAEAGVDAAKAGGFTAIGVG
ncbi:MAG: beta-phosphoglucomutase, partial [Clostridia bacterium]|nr:beta-phosphoglucomutase [Clostridia bacterium]